MAIMLLISDESCFKNTSGSLADVCPVARARHTTSEQEKQDVNSCCVVPRFKRRTVAIQICTGFNHGFIDVDQLFCTYSSRMSI